VNRKILLTVLALAIVLLATPILGTAQAWGYKSVPQELNVKLYGSVLTAINIKPCPRDALLTMEDGVYTDPNLKYVYLEQSMAADLVILTIGGEVFSTADNEMAFYGTYWGVIFNPTDGQNDYTRYFIIWRLDFNPATTGIDGSIVFYAVGYGDMAYTPLSAGGLPGIEDHGVGFGTGDLRGVRTEDTGNLVFDFTKTPPAWVEHRGTITGFPQP